MAFTTTHGIKDLTAYASIESAVFIEWNIPVLGTKYLSDYNSAVTIDGNVYTSVGDLLNVTEAASELRATSGSLAIALSGVPVNAISDLVNNDIKGSSITVRRIYKNKQGVQEGAYIVFKGIVTNYSISDDVNASSKTATTVITLSVSNAVEILSKKVAGRRTNPEDFPNDLAFSRVRLLKDRKFKFGGKNK